MSLDKISGVLLLIKIRVFVTFPPLLIDFFHLTSLYLYVPLFNF